MKLGFPVNAQFILNEWLFVKTADNDEGFVPYICCRPILRRQSTKYFNNVEDFYKPYDFAKSPLKNIPVLTPPPNNKFSLSLALGSQSFSFQNSLLCKKRQDVTSSSCGGDSGFSDYESSSHNHHRHYHQCPSFDLSKQRYTRLSNIRSLRSSSNAIENDHLIVQDFPIKKSTKNCSNEMISKSDDFNRIKSQLFISSNSAFKQFVKRNINPNSQMER